MNSVMNLTMGEVVMLYCVRARMWARDSATTKRVKVLILFSIRVSIYGMAAIARGQGCKFLPSVLLVLGLY